jgi:hypothetical protein
MRGAYYLGLLLLFFVLSTFTAGTIELGFGFSLSKFSSFFSWVIFAISYYFFVYRQNALTLKNQLILLLIFSIVLITSFFVCSYFIDFSFDGQWYHQNAILLLNDGWNPFYSTPITNRETISMDEDYLNHYAKASWIVESVWYKVFPTIQTSKADHIILALASFLLSAEKIATWFNIKKITSLSFAALLCFSPIVFGQMFNFYVDGLVASSLIVLILFLIDVAKNELSFQTIVILIFLFGYTINLKFTALVYSFIFAVFTLAWIFLFSRKELFRKSVFFSIIIFFGIFLFGYPTYIRNTLTKGNPFYPLMGKNSYGQRIAEIQYPSNFFGKNRFEKYYLSTFSEPEYKSSNQFPSRTKKLFHFENIKSGIDYYRNLQPVVMSPLGPFNGEFVVLIIPLLIALFWSVRKLWFYFIFTAFLTTILIQPEFWNFRYTPQVWFLYFFILISSFVLLKKIMRYYSVFLCVVISFSFIYCHYAYFSCTKNFTNEIRTEMNELKNKKIVIKPSWLKSAVVRIEEFELNYRLAKETDTVLNFKLFKGDFVTKCLYAIEE